MAITKRARYAGYLARSRFSGKSSARVVRRKYTSVPLRRRPGLRAKLLKYNLHSYIRWGSTAEVSTTSGTVSYSKVFQLSDTVNSSELTQLYDQYMIKGVKVKVQLLSNPDASMQPVSGSTTTSNALNWYPKLWYVRDYDNTALEAVDDLKQRNNAKCKVMRPNSFISFYVKPAVLNTIDVGDATTATAPIWNQWLDCSQSQIRHYGVKMAFDNSYSTTQTWRYRIEFQYYLQFKNAR